MDINGKKIGFGFTASHHSHALILPELERLVSLGADVYPIVTPNVENTNTVHGKATEHIHRIQTLTGKPIISTLVEAEPFGPKNPLDCMVISPLTGNSLSKLATGHVDNAVLMAAKSTLRNNSPVVLGVTTNDALGLNGENLMKLLTTKNIYFIPFGQDNPYKKQNSLVANWPQLIETIQFSLEGKQIQPLLVTYPS